MNASDPGDPIDPRLELERQLRRHPTRSAARATAIALVLLATVTLWRQGHTPLADRLWLAATLIFPIAWVLPLPRTRRFARDAAMAAAVVVALGLIPRLVGIDHLALGIQGDESATALATRQVIRDGTTNLFQDRAFGIPSLGYAWFVPLVQIVGSPIAAVRLTSAVAGAATVAMVGVWGWTLGGARLAVTAAALMATAHTAVYLSHLGTSNAVALLCATSALSLASVALARQSVLAGVLTALAIVGVWCTWAGAREVLPVLALGVLVAWPALAGSPTRRLGPFLLALVGGLALLVGPALAAGPENVRAFVFPRSDSALFAAAAWDHAAQGAGSDQVPAVLVFQVGRVLSAFAPETVGDRSPFYHFARPIVDPFTLLLAIGGCALVLRLPRLQRLWLLPTGLTVVALTTAVATVNPPDYPRLSLLLPALALLAGVPLAWLSTRGRPGLLLVVGIVVAIGGLNLWWFFVDYPREGQGDFEQLLLVGLAERGPVYVVTPGFYFPHETLALLDPAHHIQPPPPTPDPGATWAAVGPDAAAQLAPLRARLPTYNLQLLTDNANRVVVYALTPP